MTNCQMRTTLRLALCPLIGMLLLSGMAEFLRARPAAENPKPKATQEVFKNIQILKDLPADDLVPAMQFITASLGVECDFCHVRNAFDKDDKKPKQTARKMMQMMFAINQQNFNGQSKVSCYSCHRGASTPVGIPMVGDTRAYIENPEAPASASGLPSPSEIIEKYAASIGGRAAIEKIATRSEAGTISFGSGPSFPVKVVSKGPAKQITAVHLPAGDANTIFNGTTGWTTSPGSPIREMHAADFEGSRLDADLQFANHLKSLFSDFKVINSEKIGDHNVVLLLANSLGQPPLELFFDRDSGLLVRQLRFGKSPLGLNPTRVDYDDYKEFDGVKVPLKITVARPKTQLNIQIDQT